MEDKHKNLRLIKQQECIPLMKNEDLKKEICNAISQGLCTVPEDLVNLFNITYEQSLNLLSDPTFLSQVRKQTQAKLQLTFNTVVPQRLNEIIKSTDNKESMQAMKLAAQLTGNLKHEGNETSININLEGLVKEAEKAINNPILNAEFERKVS